MYDNIYAPLSGFEHSGEGINDYYPRNAKLFNELSTPVSGNAKFKNESWYKMRYNSWADVCCLLAEL